MSSNVFCKGQTVSILDFMSLIVFVWVSLVAQMIKNLPANTGDTGDLALIPGLGRSTGGGNGNPLQYSCVENPMDREAWRATVRGVAKSQTQLSRHMQLHEVDKTYCCPPAINDWMDEAETC